MYWHSRMAKATTQPPPSRSSHNYYDLFHFLLRAMPKKKEGKKNSIFVHDVLVKVHPVVTKQLVF